MAELTDEATEDVPAQLSCPSAHCRQVGSTIHLESLNRKLRRHTDMIGIFAREAALIRLTGAVLAEQHDARQVRQFYVRTGSTVPLERKEAEQTPVIGAKRTRGEVHRKQGLVHGRHPMNCDRVEENGVAIIVHGAATHECVTFAEEQSTGVILPYLRCLAEHLLHECSGRVDEDGRLVPVHSEPVASRCQ